MIDAAAVHDALASIDGPDSPGVSLVARGLVSGVAIAAGRVEIDLVPVDGVCPAMTMVAADVEATVAALPGVEAVTVRFVDPPSDDDRPSSGRALADDPAADLLGCRIDAVGDGQAVVSMDVGDDLINGLGVCHGGFIFTLADTAMAHASNSHGQPAFAVAASIDFVAPGRRGAVLRAEARETFRRGRTALYDVDVTDETGALIARFHGRTQHPTR